MKVNKVRARRRGAGEGRARQSLSFSAAWALTGVCVLITARRETNVASLRTLAQIDKSTNGTDVRFAKKNGGSNTLRSSSTRERLPNLACIRVSPPAAVDGAGPAGGVPAGSKLYLTSLIGYPKLKDDRKSIISDLALSDYDLQARPLGRFVGRTVGQRS